MSFIKNNHVITDFYVNGMEMDSPSPVTIDIDSLITYDTEEHEPDDRDYFIQRMLKYLERNCTILQKQCADWDRAADMVSKLGKNLGIDNILSHPGILQIIALKIYASNPYRELQWSQKHI
jgi:hypothetical protein